MTSHFPPAVLRVTRNDRYVVDPQWIVLTLAIVIFGWNFWGTSIYMLDEAKNAGSAAEMIRRGDYAVPTFNGEYHDKPALQYFFMIAGYRLFDVSPFGARIFSVLMGVITVMSIFRFSRMIFNVRTALLASIIYITSLQMAVQFRMAVPDPYLLACLTIGWLCFYIGYSKNRPAYLYAFYLLTGLAFLAKGPIAFALTGLSVLLFILISRDFSFRRLIELKLLPGSVLTLAVAVPWYVTSGLATNWQWPEYFFFTHNLDRYVNTFEGHGGFPFDVVLILFAALLPASVLLPHAIHHSIRHRKENSFFVFSLSIIAAVLGFFFFSRTVLPSYPAPCVAFAAILLGRYIDSVTTLDKWIIAASVVALIICSALPLAAYIAMKQDPSLSSLTALSLLFLPAAIGALAAVVYLVKKRNLVNAVYSWTAGFAVVLLLVFTWLFPAIDRQNPVAKSVDIMQNTYRSLAYYKRINSSYVFYHGQPIQKLSTPEDVADFKARNPHVMIISTATDWAEINDPSFKVIFRNKDLFESPESVVVVND